MGEDSQGKFLGQADSLGNSYRGAAEQARRAISDMYQSIADAARSANQSAENLTRSFNRRYWWSVLVLTSVALVLGFAVGIMFMRQLKFAGSK